MLEFLCEKYKNIGKKEGKQEGKKEEKQENAKNLLLLGVPIEIIAKAIGLSEEDIKKLQ